jgi:hypothetical protein
VQVVRELEASSEDQAQQAPTPPNFADYREFILNSQAYRWLLSAVTVHSQLEFREKSSMVHIRESVRNQILARAPFRKLSRQEALASITVEFALDWDLRQFLMDQEYSVSDAEALDRVICLTGTWDQAQAATTSDYMQQVWPLNNRPIRQLLKKFLRTPASETSGVVELRAEEMGEVSGGSSLRYIQYSSSCVVVAIGQVHFVSEVAEQLGWLGSALRSSPISEGIVACSPRLSRLRILTEDTENDGAITASCRIEFPLRVDASMNPQSQGFCWANLFRNPVLVTGYPIPRRAESKTGLEISLAMMAELVQSQSLVKIAERTILKGFCSLAVVTGVVRDAIIWHFLFNSSGERISYSDHRLEDIDYGKAQALTLRGVGSGRHIIGWCGDIKDYLGKSRGTYV